MAKSKKRKKKGRGSLVQVSAGVPATAPERIQGQRSYDLPYSAPAPRLINPELGLHNLVARAGHNAAYEIDVTLLDAPDHRLIRSGVLLAHRVLEGRGEWFLTAPDWQPLLPKDRIELMGHSDLPEGLADLIRPLRRRATLGPVAALNCDRREFALRDDQGTTMALLRDDKVTVRKGGLTTARYREVLITAIGPGLNDDQVAWTDRALLAAGATYVPRFPRLTARLGAPATGPTDLPVAEPFDAGAPFKRFVSHLIAGRLRSIVEADLAIRGGDSAAITGLADDVDGLRGELAGLSAVLDADWVAELDEDLGWLSAEADRDQVAARLRGERYLSLLERLVTAVRTPRLTEGRAATAGELLADLVDGSLDRLRRAANGLKVDAHHQDWAEAWTEIERLHRVLTVAAVARPIEPLTALLAEPTRLLAQVRADQQAEETARAGIADLDAEAAFEVGREFERQQAKAHRTRRDFVKRWAKLSRKLTA